MCYTIGIWAASRLWNRLCHNERVTCDYSLVSCGHLDRASATAGVPDPSRHTARNYLGSALPTPGTPAVPATELPAAASDPAWQQAPQVPASQPAWHLAQLETGSPSAFQAGPLQAATQGVMRAAPYEPQSSVLPPNPPQAESPVGLQALPTVFASSSALPALPTAGVGHLSQQMQPAGATHVAAGGVQVCS